MVLSQRRLSKHLPLLREPSRGAQLRVSSMARLLQFFSHYRELDRERSGRKEYSQWVIQLCLVKQQRCTAKHHAISILLLSQRLLQKLATSRNCSVEMLSSDRMRLCSTG